MSSDNSVEQVASRLCKEALQNGGYDNISIIAIRSDVFEQGVGWRTIDNNVADQGELLCEAAGEELRDDTPRADAPSVLMGAGNSQDSGNQKKGVINSEENENN